jgi:DNA-binding response OmpR family regulator
MTNICQKPTILIVEDEQKIRTALRDFLEFHGFGVSEAVDGLEAEHMVAEKEFALILLDLMLPGISGEQLYSKWRQEGLQTPIIVLTAKGQEKLNLGNDDYITKPFSLEKLLDKIKAML